MTTIDRARLAIPLLQAIVEGKTLQYLRDGEEGDPWVDDPPEKQDDSTLRGTVTNAQNWRIKPQQRVPETINDLHQLTIEEIVARSHVIIGPNGQCLCGVYEGVAFHCSQILKMKWPVQCDIRRQATDGSDY